MKIVTITRITVDKATEEEKANELMADDDWTLYETFYNYSHYYWVFEKISEVIIT